MTKNNIIAIDSTKTTRKPRTKKQTDEQRFRASIGEPDANGCHNWTGNTFSNGYGHFCADGTVYYAHRYAFQLSSGAPIPQGKYVLHSCDNRLCCNPKHLRLGSAAENSADMVQRGRSTKGRSVARRLFTDAEIAKIIDLSASGQTQYRIAKVMERSEPVISAVLKRKASEIEAKKKMLALKSTVITILEPLNATVRTVMADLKKIAA